MPERDADGRITGINRRYKNGSKRLITGSNRGLTYAAVWDNGEGPVFVPEGFSDAAAMLSMGLRAVSRPSDQGGKALLSKLLANEADIVIIAERDEKSDGAFPGRKGAIDNAKYLADILGRPARWTFTPGDIKDARSWLRGKTNDLTDTKNLLALGRELCEYIDTIAITVRPSNNMIPLREPPPAVELADWYPQQTSAREKILGEHVIALDRSPVGAGKSHADIEMVKDAEALGLNTLTAVPTHKAAKEKQKEMKKQGILAERSPILEEECQNISKAKLARESGLSILATVCLECKYNKSCSYLDKDKSVREAQHAIITHKRFACLSTSAEGRQVILIDENPMDTMVSTTGFSSADLRDVADFIQKAKAEADGRYPGGDASQWLWRLETHALDLIAKEETATHTQGVEVPAKWGSPRVWQLDAWHAIEKINAQAEAEKTAGFKINGDALRSLVSVRKLVWSDDLGV